MPHPLAETRRITVSPTRRIEFRRWLRIASIVVGSVLALMVAAGVWIAATFDANAYKPWLMEQVRERYQRTLVLDGDIRVSWLPTIRAEVGRASLSERAGSSGSATEFAVAERLRFALALWPLQQRRVEVKELSATGLRITLITRRDGSRNFDDLLDSDRAAGKVPAPPGAATSAPAQPVRLDISRIVIENGQLAVRDERAGTGLEVSALELTSGRLGGNSADPFAVSATVKSSAPAFDLRIEAKGRLLVDIEAARFGASALAGGAVGNYGGVPLDLKLELPELLAAPKALQVNRLKLSARLGDARSTTIIEATLPALTVKDGAFGGANLGVVIDRKSATDTLNVRIGAPLEGLLSDSSALPRRIDAREIKADMEGKLGGKTVQGQARAQFSADLAAGRYELTKLALKATLFGLDAPVRDVTVALNGSAAYEGSAGRQPTSSASIDGRVNETALRARFTRSGATGPIVFDVEADQFDLDRYLQSNTATSAGGGATAKGGVKAEAPLDFDFLDGLELGGVLRVGALKAIGVRANNVRVEVKVSAGRLDLAPIAASLYSGRLDGALSLIDAKPPRVALRQQLRAVQVGPLLADAANLDLIEGRGDVRLDITTQGTSVDAFKRALDGSASISLADGSLRGVNIAGVLREARTRLEQARGRQVQPSAATEKTDFSELKASFAIRGGVARNSDLSLKSPLLRAGGAGSLDIGAGTVDYLLRPTIVGSLGGQGGREASALRGVTVPVRISGPFAQLQYDFDLQSTLVDTARQELQRRATDLLRDRLPGVNPGGGAPADGKTGGSAPGSKGDGRPAPIDLLKGIFGR
ncbi:MAG: AsmA family protein [Proteobacteria bacterium]|nr:AsmA family protein [Burkholderiales bacterium]